jgi:hypothetical protein
MNTPESLNGMVSDLIRRGLPSEYAQRAAAEFADHHRDLVEELQAAGFSESQAQTEASHRLGDTRTLVKKTTRGYQQRFWCARWPLITFLLAPLPTFIAVWLISGYSILGVIKLLGLLGCVETNQHSSGIGSPAVRVMQFAFVVWSLLVLPAIVTFVFARLAKRASLSWCWIAVVACIVGVSVGTIQFERLSTARHFPTIHNSTGKPVPEHVYTLVVPLFEPNYWSGRSMFRWYTHGVLQPFQLLLPAIVGAMVLLRCQQLSRRRVRLHLADC